MKTRLTALVLLLFFAACGGGSGGGSETVESDPVVNEDPVDLEEETDTEEETDPEVLHVPTEFSLDFDNSDKTKAVLNWKVVNLAESYRVKRSLGDDDYEVIGEPSTNGFTDDSIEKGYTYRYKVAAVNGDDTTDDTSYVEYIVALDAPSNVSASSGNTESITLTWDADTAAESYQVYKYNSYDNAYIAYDTASDASYTDDSADLDVGTVYKYKVASVSPHNGLAGDKSDAVESYLVTTGVATNVQATDSRFSKIDITWNKAADADRYVIYRDDVEIGDVTGESYSDDDSSLVAGTDYTYKVRAYTSENYSDIATGSLRSTPVSCTVSWSKNRESAVNSAGGKYTVYVGTSSGFDIEDAHLSKVVTNDGSGGDTDTTTDIDITSAGTYYVKVIASGTIDGTEYTSELSEEIVLVVE